MEFLKRNKVVSKRSQFKIICLMFFLIIIMMKIVSYTCQELKVSVSNKDVSQTVFSSSVHNLAPCSGKPNCFYQKNSKKCTKLTRLNLMLNFSEEVGVKPPPLIAALRLAMEDYKKGLLNGAYIEMNKNKPLELILCDKRLDILQWAKTSVTANTSLPATSNITFHIIYPDSRRTQKIKTIALEFSSIFVVIFNEPPECVLVDGYNHKVFWSDINRGTIKAYDTKTNEMIILAKSLEMPGSMVFDPTLKLLFWCNHNFKGSIERVNFDGDNRVEITKGKHVLFYPENLGIDLTHRMLYWIEHGVIHTSDYNGDHHKVMEKSHIYDQNFPSCFSFAANDVEHNFFLENPQLQHFNRAFVPNYLVSISYQKDGKALKNMHLPAVFREHQNLEYIKWLTSNMKCPESISKSQHCFLLPITINHTISQTLDFHTLSPTGYQSVKLHNMSKFLGQKDLGIDIKWFYLNQKPQTILFYDPIAKHIRYLFYVIRNKNYTDLYKFKSSQVINYIFENIHVFTTDLIIFDPTEESFYLLNTTNNPTKSFGIDGNDDWTSSTPNIISYVTNVMDDSHNDGQSNKIEIPNKKDMKNYDIGEVKKYLSRGWRILMTHMTK